MINVLDNECTKPSPCKNCHWHIQGIEKNRCVKICQRLEAYRDGTEYNHLPWPRLEDLQEAEEESEVKICEICRLKGKETPAKTRGLCRNCYALWQSNGVDHPTFGKFKRKTTNEISPKKTNHRVKLSRVVENKKKAKDSMPDMKKTAIKRNKNDDTKESECDNRMLRGNTLVNNIAKRINKVKERKGATKHSDKITKKVDSKKRKYSPSVRVYLNKYPKIKEFLNKVSEEQGLPKNHIAITLLSEAIAVRTKNG